MKIVIGLRHTQAHNGVDMAKMLDMVRGSAMQTMTAKPPNVTSYG